MFHCRVQGQEQVAFKYFFVLLYLLRNFVWRNQFFDWYVLPLLSGSQLTRKGSKE